MIDLLVAAAGFAAGFINVLAGGGSFLTLPALIAAGLSALDANASSTVALFPAQAITSMMARRSMVDPRSAGLDIDVRTLIGISLVGGLLGALLLLATPPGVFVGVIPWLVLFATVIFAKGPSLSRGVAGFRLGRRGIYVVQGVVSIYGGYFGGGIGIMMLAALTIFGLRDVKAMNSLKIVLAMLMNVAAVATFAVAGLVRWHQTLVLGGGAIVGGLVGILAVRHVPAPWVRAFVIVVGLLLSLAFFLRLGV